jgi:hypothetical protein
LTIGATISGLPTGSKTVSASATLSSAVGGTVDTVLASGANTINVPTGATYAIIQPPTGNSIAVTLKGVTGDTGVKLHLTAPTCIAIDPTTATFVLTAASAFSNAHEINFI